MNFYQHMKFIFELPGRVQPSLTLEAGETASLVQNTNDNSTNHSKAEMLSLTGCKAHNTSENISVTSLMVQLSAHGLCKFSGLKSTQQLQ